MTDIIIYTNIPADKHPDLTRVAFAIGDAFGTRAWTAPREEATPDTRPLIDCVSCGDLHYAPYCPSPATQYCSPNDDPCPRSRGCDYCNA